MRIIYLGAGEFGLPTLQALHQAHEVAMVITQPDRPAGRQRQLAATPIGQWTQDAGLPLVKTDKVNDSSILQHIAALNADAMVIVAFGQYLKQSLVNLPRLGAMNLHASLLPRWRGASPIHATLLHGDTHAGNTVIRIAPSMDAGPILAQHAIPVDPHLTTGELHDHLATLGAPLILDVLDGLHTGQIQPVTQNDDLATTAPKLSRADGFIDWHAHATTIRQRVHGLTPWPGVTVAWSSPDQPAPQPLLLRRVRDLPDFKHNRTPGSLLDTSGHVATGSGAVQLLEVQPPGKRIMSWDDFTRGHPIAPGAIFHRDAQAAS